jgi:hypothetical protein
MSVPRTVPLVRDVLDVQVFDREKRPMGKVDGIALELADGAAPRVAYLEVDAASAWRRLGERFGHWARRAQALWGGAPFRFRWSQVRELSVHLEVDVDAEETAAFALERRIREKL